MENENYAVEISNLSKSYGANKALKGISFNVKHGEIMGFLGPNGAGKSTTMNILTGCISSSGGSAKVCGCDILEYPDIAKRKIGYLPENPPLYFDMKVIEYLNFVYDLKKVKLDKKSHIAQILQLVGLEKIQRRLIRNLSKGYKQRVGLAQALIGDPEVLILDEPTVGLDPSQIVEIRNVIKKIGKERTVILSTHILQEVSAICDSVTIISSGNIVAKNTLGGLLEEMGEKNVYTIVIEGDTQKAAAVISEVQAVAHVEIIGENTLNVVKKHEGEVLLDITKKLAENDIAIAQMKTGEMSLEEIFIKLTDPVVSAESEEEEV